MKQKFGNFWHNYSNDFQTSYLFFHDTKASTSTSRLIFSRAYSLLTPLTLTQNSQTPRFSKTERESSPNWCS